MQDEPGCGPKGTEPTKRETNTLQVQAADSHQREGATSKDEKPHTHHQDLHFITPLDEDTVHRLLASESNCNLPGYAGLPLHSSLRVLFIHGGGWGQGRHLGQQEFALYLRKHFKQCHIEEMQNTSLFNACIAQQSHAIVEFQPHVVVCKSQGGPTLLRLIHDGVWKGPSIMCCPAVVPGIDNFDLPDGVPFVLLSGADDVAVPVRNVVALQHHNAVRDVRRVIVRDDHGLYSLLKDDCQFEDCTAQTATHEHIDYCLQHIVEHTWKLYLAKAPESRTPVNEFCAKEVPKQHWETWVRHQESKRREQTRPRAVHKCLVL
eukprot:INCI6189.3.p1 GENE.INCI6189.3~~INCI6189.3.p1  ORF type:complete len:319 (+),score=45.10 INCI6189.3:214-1170(+)